MLYYEASSAFLFIPHLSFLLASFLSFRHRDNYAVRVLQICWKPFSYLFSHSQVQSCKKCWTVPGTQIWGPNIFRKVNFFKNATKVCKSIFLFFYKIPKLAKFCSTYPNLVLIDSGLVKSSLILRKSWQSGNYVKTNKKLRIPNWSVNSVHEFLRLEVSSAQKKSLPLLLCYQSEATVCYHHH